MDNMTDAIKYNVLIPVLQGEAKVGLTMFYAGYFLGFGTKLHILGSATI